MRVLLLTLIWGLGFIQANAQVEISASKIPKRVLRDQTEKICNYYTLAVLNTVDLTKGFDVESLRDRFTDNATIEVSNVYKKQNEPPQSVRGYFTKLRDLRINTYDNIIISFRHIIVSDPMIICIDNSCTVEIPVGQKFTAFKKGKIAYADYTIKKITLVFFRRPDGMITAKISKVSVEKTFPA